MDSQTMYYSQEQPSSGVKMMPMGQQQYVQQSSPSSQLIYSNAAPPTTPHQGGQQTTFYASPSSGSQQLSNVPQVFTIGAQRPTAPQQQSQQVYSNQPHVISMGGAQPQQQTLFYQGGASPQTNNVATYQQQQPQQVQFQQQPRGQQVVYQQQPSPGGQQQQTSQAIYQSGGQYSPQIPQQSPGQNTVQYQPQNQVQIQPLISMNQVQMQPTQVRKPTQQAQPIQIMQQSQQQPQQIQMIQQKPMQYQQQSQPIPTSPSVQVVRFAQPTQQPEMQQQSYVSAVRAGPVDSRMTNQTNVTFQPMGADVRMAQQSAQFVPAQPRQQPQQIFSSTAPQQYYQQQQQQQQQQPQQYNQPIQQQQQQQQFQPQQYQTQQPIQVQNQARIPAQTQQGLRSDTANVNREPKLRTLQPRFVGSMDKSEYDGPPQFVTHPQPQITVNEGDGFTLKALCRPAGDSKLQVEWLKDGVVIVASSRHNPSFDRGYAIFQFLYTHLTDSGEYVCVAKNSQGQAQSTSCIVTIIPEDDVITESQLPEESMIRNLAEMENQLAMNGAPRQEEEKKFVKPPQMLRPLLAQLNLKENERAKFETFVQPSNDPSLVVEWYKDGKPLKTGCRFSTIMDRGYAILDIHYTYPEDSGEYMCVATNSAGSIQSNVVNLTCKGDANILTDSVLSHESITYLKSLDGVNSAHEVRYTETEEVPTAPVFEIMPQPMTAIEGSPVRLLVKAGGYPHPRVSWFINGDVLPSSGGGGAWRIFSDGGISYLEFQHCGPPGEYQVTVQAKNKMGETSTSCELIVDPQPDYRPDLKHIAPENPFKRLSILKKVERSSELTKAFVKPKANALDLRKLERRNSQAGELNDTEVLYAQVQASLRSSRSGSFSGPIGVQPQPALQPMLKPAQHVQQVSRAHQVQQVPQVQPVQQMQQVPQVQQIQQVRQVQQVPQVEQPKPPQVAPAPPPPPPPAPKLEPVAPATPSPAAPQPEYSLQTAGIVDGHEPEYSVTSTNAEFEIEL